MHLRAAVALTLLVLATTTLPSAAHETTAVGGIELTLGWRDEPPLAGEANAVELLVKDRSGSPVDDQTASLLVTVAAGNDRLELLLRPGAPGSFVAPVVPTRAGVYRFSVTGRVGGELVELDVECGDGSFDCVTERAAIEVPPAGATDELAEGMDRAVRRADRARDDARRAERVAAVAVAVAVAAVTVALVSARRHRTR